MSKVINLYNRSQEMISDSLVISRDPNLRVLEMEKLRSRSIEESLDESTVSYNDLLDSLYTKLLQDPPKVYDEDTGEYESIPVVLSPSEILRRIRSIHRLVDGITDSMLTMLELTYNLTKRD